MARIYTGPLIAICVDLCLPCGNVRYGVLGDECCSNHSGVAAGERAEAVESAGERRFHNPDSTAA
jgi:hypothetical protein